MLAMLILQNIRCGLRLAIRAQFSWLAGGSLLTMLIAATLSAQFSGRQPATTALDVGISTIRLLLPLVIVLLTQELLSREFDRRYFLSTLSYPAPRRSVVLGRFISITLLTTLLLIGAAAILALLVWLKMQTYTQGTQPALGSPFLITIFFIGLDLLVVISVAVLLAVISSTPGLVLVGTLGFAIIARSFGSVIELLTRNYGIVTDAETYLFSIGLLRYLLPDLGALDIRMITLYGRIDFLPADWPWLVLSSLTYTVGLLSLAVWALQRKRFA